MTEQFTIQQINRLGFTGPDGYVDLNILDSYVEKKLLRRARHPWKDLYLYKYTEQCTFEKAWDYVTLLCRGLVVNGNGKVISHPFHKFFNYGEQPNGYLPPKDEEYEIYEKMDGSLIVASLYEDELLVTSSGSFESQQARWAESLIKATYNWKAYILPGFTYIFELIHPDNQIVVNYGDTTDLILLGVRNTENGHDHRSGHLGFYPWKPARVYKGLRLEDALKEQKQKEFINREGYIVRWKSGYRLKIKFDEYCRIHKIATNFTERHIWEAMRDGVDLPLDNLPDEMYTWIKDAQATIAANFEKVSSDAEVAYEYALGKMPSDFKKLPHNWKKKHFAKEVSKPEYAEYRSILFAMIDGKSYKHIIWQMIKPSEAAQDIKPSEKDKKEE